MIEAVTCCADAPHSSIQASFIASMEADADVNAHQVMQLT